MKWTKQKVAASLSRQMVEFGYPDCTPEMMAEVYEAYIEGKRGSDLPHDVLGMMVESQLNELADRVPVRDWPR